MQPVETLSLRSGVMRGRCGSVYKKSEAPRKRQKNGARYWLAAKISTFDPAYALPANERNGYQKDKKRGVPGGWPIFFKYYCPGIFEVSNFNFYGQPGAAWIFSWSPERLVYFSPCPLRQTRPFATGSKIILYYHILNTDNALFACPTLAVRVKL